MALGGLSVATSADLNVAIRSMDEKFDSHRKWSEQQITDCIIKLRQSGEKLDSLERDSSTQMESVSTELKAVRAGYVPNASFRQQLSQIEKRFHDEKDEVDARLDQLRTALEKDMISNIGNLRLKAETLNANCIGLTEKCKLIEDTLLPSIRSELEEQKAKRLIETQRLESDSEKVRDICEQKISHTAAALRFYVSATATKLRDELTPLTMAKELEVDLAHKEADLKKLIKSVEDVAVSTRVEVGNQKAYLDSSHEKFTIELGQHCKTVKVLEITMVNLQNSVATDLSDNREETRNEVTKMKIDVADCRSTAIRAAAANEANIHRVASEIVPLKQFRELIVERLQIEKVCNIMREWQTLTIPQVTSQAKDLEDRAKKMLTNQVKDHEIIIELQKSTSEIRRHFKLFHHIAAGLDDTPHPSAPDPMMPPVMAATCDTRLPPIEKDMCARVT